MPPGKGKKGNKKTPPPGAEQPDTKQDSVKTSSKLRCTPAELKLLEEFDFVRFTYADIHGIGRYKMVAKCYLREQLSGVFEIHTPGSRQLL